MRRPASISTKQHSCYHGVDGPIHKIYTFEQVVFEFRGALEMDTITPMVQAFFEGLSLREDALNGHRFKLYIKEAVLDFLRNGTKDAAFAVYRTFFDCYRITLSDDSGNAFIDLLDVLRSYEENAATLIDKQRDHYIHSVNVFVLGLIIYGQNTPYQKAFDKAAIPYEGCYTTPQEEFFFRWGMAALFHDVGYPVEIIARQINHFIQFATDVDGDTVKVRSHLAFENFHELNSVEEVVPKREFIAKFYDNHDNTEYVDLLKPIDLLAHKLHLAYGIEIRTMKQALDDFQAVMAAKGFIDHGYYSAIIVLKWYGFLVQKAGYSPDCFYYPVLDSASAILLHNYYRNVMMKPPFALGAMSVHQHPLAYLLILCDELQEWNRQPYGIKDRRRVHVDEAEIRISNCSMEVLYHAYKGALPKEYAQEKMRLLNAVLQLDEIFPDGFRVAEESGIQEGMPAPSQGEPTPATVSPRPLMGDLERLAEAVHDLYNQMQLARHPDRPLAHPTFADLPDDMKYSNLRQARAIPDKLALVGYVMRPARIGQPGIMEFPADVVEYLAMVEHEEWVQERVDSGWKYSERRDTEARLSPYLVTYDELPEEIREYDRDAIRNIPRLLAMIGMGAYSANA